MCSATMHVASICRHKALPATADTLTRPTSWYYRCRQLDKYLPRGLQGACECWTVSTARCSAANWAAMHDKAIDMHAQDKLSRTWPCHHHAQGSGVGARCLGPLLSVYTTTHTCYRPRPRGQHTAVNTTLHGHKCTACTTHCPPELPTLVNTTQERCTATARPGRLACTAVMYRQLGPKAKCTEAMPLLNDTQQAHRVWIPANRAARHVKTTHAPSQSNTYPPTTRLCPDTLQERLTQPHA